VETGRALRPGYYVGKPLFGKLEKLEAGILLKSKKYYHESTGNVNKDGLSFDNTS
jgi:hypothetical protein